MNGGLPVAPEEAPVIERLTALGLTWERYEHPPIFTAEAAGEHWASIDAVHCKNLFLRNQKGSRHYLVVLEHNKRADLRKVAEQVGDGKLSFASAERLLQYLGVTPGSVSPFGLIHDTTQHVRLFLDRSLRSAARISFHPNINTLTYVLSGSDFAKYLAATGAQVRDITVSVD